MNRRGIFGPVITMVLLAMLIFIWVIILPNITPLIGDTLASTSSGPHADGVAFFLRMIPWMVPFIIVIGFLWLMVR